MHCLVFLVTFCDLVWHDIERKRCLTHSAKNNKLIYDSIVHPKGHSIRFKWHLLYTLMRNEYLKFLRKHALLAASTDTGVVSSTTAAAVVLTTNVTDHKQFNSEPSHSSILLYDRPIMRQAPQPAKRSGYRYNFDYEQTSDLRFIYQQLKCLTNNVAQLKNHPRAADDDTQLEQQQIYLSPNRSSVTCTFAEDHDDSTSKFHQMPTIQRR